MAPSRLFWKTRWEFSIDGSGTPYRTLVCYKETHDNAKIDPTSTWTGTWRDPRFTQPPNGGSPENALTGTIFGVNALSAESITVPAAYGKHRFWRNTSVATLTSGQAAVFAPGTLGYEWDQSPNNGFQPQALMRLSSVTVRVPQLLLDYGSTYGPGQAAHSLSLYRHSSGALVFGAGTVQWSWGLDSAHDYQPLTDYDKTYGWPVVFEPQSLANILGEAVSHAGLARLRIVEGCRRSPSPAGNGEPVGGHGIPASNFTGWP